MKRQVLTPFAKLKRRILREFPKKKLIGDIVISVDEYTLLIEYLCNVYKSLSKDLFTVHTDLVLSVAIVQIGIKYYDSNYWAHVANELGVSLIPNKHRNRLGDCFRKTLREYNKSLLNASELVKSILMHGFVSIHYADDLFNFLFSFYKLDLERDMDRLDGEMMTSLIEVMARNDSTDRTYWLVQQTADAIRANPTGSKIRIRRLLRLIDRCFWEQITPVNSPNRLSQCFNSWQENSKEFTMEYHKYHGGNSAGQGKKSFSSPYLKCDFSSTSFRLYCPTQLIMFEYDKGVYWKITQGGNTMRVDVDLYQGVTGYKTNEININIGSDALLQEIDIELMCDDFRLRRFRMVSDCVRFFNKTGQSIQPDSLPTGEVYAFTLFNDILTSEAFIDRERRRGLSLTYFDFQYGDILRLPDSAFLSVGKKVEEGLLPRGRIIGAYGINEEDLQIPLYKKPPTVLVRMLPSREPGTLIRINDHQYRLFDERTTVIEINDRSGEKGYIINLSEYGCTADGKYQLLIDVPNDRRNRYWEFTLIRDFSFEFEDAPYIFSPRGTVRLNESLQVVADDRSKKMSGENAFNFEIGAAHDFIEFATLSDSTNIPFRIYVPALKWQFNDDQWQIEKPSEIWHSEFPNTIKIKYPDDTITMSLDDPSDDDALEQCASFTKLKEKHLFECDVTRFKSWFGRNPAIRHIYLDFPRNRQEFISVVTRSVVASCLIRGDFARGRLIGDFNILGKADYCVDIEYNGSLLTEKETIAQNRIDVPAQLRSGRYKITIFESEEDDTGFGDILYLPIGTFEHDLLNPSDLSGKNFIIKHIKDGERSVFNMPLSCDYYVDNLKRHDLDDMGTYFGRMYAKGFDGRILTSFDVRVRFFDPERLSLVHLTLRNDDEYIEFLYDHKRKIIVRDEDRSLHRTERYRRFIPLYEEYVFVINFVDQDQSIRRPSVQAMN